MRRAQHPVFACIGKTLNSRYDECQVCPAPPGWCRVGTRSPPADRTELSCAACHSMRPNDVRGEGDGCAPQATVANDPPSAGRPSELGEGWDRAIGVSGHDALLGEASRRSALALCLRRAH